MSRKSHKPGKHIRKENKKITHSNLRDTSEGSTTTLHFKSGTPTYTVSAPSK